jgi:hypothetical protein
VGASSAAETARRQIRPPTRQPVGQPVGQPGRARAGKHVAPRSRRHRVQLHGQWLMVAAAAVIGLALGVGATRALSNDSAPSASVQPTKQPASQLSKTDGTVVGAVATISVDAKQVYVVTVSSGPVGMHYKCELKLRDGRLVPAARVLLRSSSAVWIVPARPKAVQLRLVAHDGDGPLWSTATL